MIDHTIGNVWPLTWSTRRLGEVQLLRHPRPQESADEAEGDGCEEPASSTRDRPADGSADSRDDEKDDEPWQCDCHGETSSLIPG